jgi:Head domain of trimeric autotransporter adhesin/Chaperone of endosialidase
MHHRQGVLMLHLIFWCISFISLIKSAAKKNKISGMKKIITIVLFITSCNTGVAQNVGIGTNEPYNKLHIVGNLLVNTPTRSTSTTPTAAQTKNMPGLGTISFLNTDSTGRLYDSGGPAGNYGIDHDGKVIIPFSSNIAIEVTVETMDLNTGDSLIIKESSTGATLLAVGNVYSSIGKWIFNSSSLYINFKSNTDFNTGAGFSILFRRLYNYGSSLPDIAGIAGTALFFDARAGAFRTGDINNSEKGQYSAAMGLGVTANGFASTAMGAGVTASGNASTAMGQSTKAIGLASTATGFITTATGENSTAMGRQTFARGDYSTAMGNFTSTSGENSTAMGRLTNASGENSTAMGKYTDATGYAATAMGDSSLASGTISYASGFRTTASGDYSTAMGRQTSASGDFSTAIGNNVSTNSKAGSFIIGDNSSASVMLSPTSNFFLARFANGYHLVTSANLSTGCSLAAGDNAWTTGSDVRTKENFAEINGEDFLKKISGFHLTSWNYKKQNPATFRHYGPMAQDFYAAFGKDKYGTIGNDTTINSADFAGVSFIAIQALEKRTTLLQKENEEVKKSLQHQQELIALLQKEIELLKRK